MPAVRFGTAPRALTLSLSSMIIFCAPLGPMPGTRVMAATLPWLIATRSSSGGSTDTTAWAIFGPMPEADWTSSNASRSSGSANP